jgi:two-component system, OmpR family, alkaline phosphatase synthesis response regulator PhoP
MIIPAILSQKKILLVDDEPDIREFVSYGLKRKGYQVITASDGKSGYELAIQFRPDIIILDIMMPVMNGYETCMRLREHPEFASTTVIFLSALNRSFVQDVSNQLNIAAFISKPIRIDSLIRKIDSLSTIN